MDYYDNLYHLTNFQLGGTLGLAISSRYTYSIKNIVFRLLSSTESLDDVCNFRSSHATIS